MVPVWDAGVHNTTRTGCFKLLAAAVLKAAKQHDMEPGPGQDGGNDGSNHHQGCRDLQRSFGSIPCTYSEVFSQSYLMRNEDMQKKCVDIIRIC